jgi:hypothetical protein
LSKEELNLVDFLVARVASLSSSMAREVFIVEMSMPPPVACEVVDLQSDLAIPPASPPVVVDAPVTVIGSSTLPTVALEHQVTGAGESFKAKPPNLSPLEVCLKGATSMCSHRSA